MREPLTICDVSPLYCETGGGIRTYHHARLEWFRRERRHRYLLICPGPRAAITELGAHAAIAQVYGVPVRGGADGYRAMLDLNAVRTLVRDRRPDVVEMGEPFLGAMLRALLRGRDGYRGRIVSFCHSDPIATHVVPRLRPAAERLFGRLQSKYDLTLVASRAMESRLRAMGVDRVARAPFGVDRRFFDVVRPPRDPSRPIALLYAGRLDADKEIGLLLDVVPRLLRRHDVTLTVVGAGRFAPEFMRLTHARFVYRDFVRDRGVLARIYAEHDILLAPGRFETFGLAALEASAAGLVVVGPDAGGTGELLAQLDAPLLFRAGDPGAFSAAIDRAIGSDLGCGSMRGRALAQAYGAWDRAVARQVAVYETLAAGR